MNSADRAALAALAQTSLDAARASRDAVAALPVDGGSPAPDPNEPQAWAERSAGRMIAHRLASADANDANLAGRHPYADYGIWTPDRADIDQYDEPEIDNGGLRFVVRTGRGIPDWYRKFLVPFGANSTFRLQFAWRCNRAFREAIFRMRDPTTGLIGGWPGIKRAIVCSAELSSDWEKLVLSTLDQHFHDIFYGYDQNGNTKNIEPAVNNGADYDWQPRLGEAPTCLYTRTNATPQGQAVPGCAALPADEWVETYVEVDTGGLIPGTNTWDAERRLYLAFNGGPRVLVIRFGPGSPGYFGRNAKPYTGLWLSPYMTMRDGQQLFPNGTPAVWYREVIVDDKDIAPMRLSDLPMPSDPLPVSNPTPQPQPDPQPTPQPAGESPDGAKVPPASQIVDATGAVWTLGAGNQAFRNGVSMGWGALLAIKYVAHTVYVQGDSGAWYEVRGTGLLQIGGEPGTTTPPPPAQTIDAFTASKTSLVNGESTTLAWAISNGDATLDVDAPGVDVPVEDVGSVTVTPNASRDYTLKVTGGAPALERVISVAVGSISVPPPDPQPDPDLPSFVPAPGTWAEFTTNTPASVGAPSTILTNWTGGAFNPDFGAMGAAMYYGGGEHFSWPDNKGGVLLLDAAARAYLMRCLPPVTTNMGVAGASGSPVDDFGCYIAGGYPQTKHSYNGVGHVPAAWGIGAQGGLIRIQSGGPLNEPLPQQVDMQGNPVFKADGTPQLRTHGWTAAHVFDVSQAIGGYRRLTGEQMIDLGSGKPSNTNDAPGIGIDMLREGHWMFARQGAGAGDRMAFIAKDGTVTSPNTTAIGLDWGRLHHFDDDDTLVAVASGIAICHPGPTNPWKRVTFNVNAADASAWTATRIQYLGYIGFHFWRLLNCFVGIDTAPVLKPDGVTKDLSAVRIWKIFPPDTAAKRWTDPWFVERETITSADGSQIDVSLDQALNSSGLSYGKLVPCDGLRSLLWTRSVNKPGQLIRPRGV